MALPSKLRRFRVNLSIFEGASLYDFLWPFLVDYKNRIFSIDDLRAYYGLYNDDLTGFVSQLIQKNYIEEVVNSISFEEFLGAQSANSEEEPESKESNSLVDSEFHLEVKERPSLDTGRVEVKL